MPDSPRQVAHHPTVEDATVDSVFWQWATDFCAKLANIEAGGQLPLGRRPAPEPQYNLADEADGLITTVVRFWTVQRGQPAWQPMARLESLPSRSLLELSGSAKRNDDAFSRFRGTSPRFLLSFAYGPPKRHGGHSRLRVRFFGKTSHQQPTVHGSGYGLRLVALTGAD